jgi:hypothetical protein
MGSRGRTFTALALLAFAAAAAARGFSAEKMDLTVSSCMADGSDEPRYPYQRATLAETFAERISVRERFTARAVKAASWQRVPEGVEASTHVSLVHVRLGAHHDFLAFLHGGPHHSLRFAARAEAVDRSDVHYWFSVPTGSHQIERNAPVDLIAHFANQFPIGAAEGDGPVVTLRLVARAAGSGGTLAMPIEAEAAALLPIFAGAACAAGLRPTFEELPDTLAVTVGLMPGGNLCDIEATLTRKQAMQVHVCRKVAFADVFDTAHLLFHGLLHWQGAVLDFTRVSDTPVRPLALVETADRQPLIVLDETEAFSGRQPASGQTAWQVARPKTDRAAWDFAEQLGADGRLRLYAGRSGFLQSVDPATGQTSALPARPKDELSLAECGDRLAAADAHTVRLFAAGKARWEKQTEWPVAGLTMDPKSVFYAGTEGSVVALAADNGSPRWRAMLPAPLGPRLTVLGGRVFGATQTGILFALAAADGKPAWQVEIGDVLRQAPQAAEAKLLVVSGTNRLLVLDEPTGACLAQRAWPTWLLSARLVHSGSGRRVVCVDPRRITLLAWPSLALQREIAVPHRLTPGTVECPAMPLPWNTHDELVGLKHVALVGDELGFLYALSLED